jgi:ribonucleoside-diphosphate reductase alpha chain
MKIVEPKQSATALEITRKRYLMTDRQGRPVETVGEMLWRVAQHMAKPEILWGSNGDVKETAEMFYEQMVRMKFVCSGKAMFEAGNPGGTGQLAACFVLPVEDSIDSIFKTLGEAAVIHKNNGGTGFNFSKIRPHGDKVKNVPGAASGPVDFIKAYSAALSKILQGAKRQGGNIAILNVDHPDIGEFIRMKDEDGMIKNFNISVGVTDEFMEAVIRKKRWRLINPRTKETAKTVRADKLFAEVCQHAWLSGDPGMAFLDRMERDNPTPTLGKLEATNPCGEIPLLPYESCNLASIVLVNHLKRKAEGWEIDWEELRKTVRIGVRFLDNMIEVNNFPLPQTERMVKEGNRRIGLGVMGFGHLLYKLEIVYNSERAVKLADRLSRFIRLEADRETERLGKERGSFGNYDVSIFVDSGKPRRNCATTMIAPTGTTALFADCSSGIEPVFSLVTLRKTFFEDDRTNRPTRELTLVDPVFYENLKLKVKNEKLRKKILERLVSEGTAKRIKEISAKMRRVFVASHEIEPEYHVRIQAAWQNHFDNSVSKTINFPYSATVEEVKEAYLMAWKLGCKGITVYRDGSKQNQVLNSSVVKMCPECGSGVETKEGCSSCVECGWSKCGL